MTIAGKVTLLESESSKEMGDLIPAVIRAGGDVYRLILPFVL